MNCTIGLGTAAIGRPQYINIRDSVGSRPFDKLAFAASGRKILDAAYASGVRYYDTAPGYGLAEELVHDWVHALANPTVEVASKWGYAYVANFDPEAEVHEVKDLTLGQLNRQWAATQRLLPYLKVYQIHSATIGSGVLSDTAVLERLAEIKRTHRVDIGLTSTGPQQGDTIRQAMEVVMDGQPLFTHYQVTYNILETSLAPLIRDLQYTGRQVIIKEALANGRLLPNDAYPHYSPLYTAMSALAEDYKVGIDAIAMRYCHDTVGPYQVLSGGSREDHLKANLLTPDIHLTHDDIRQLSAYSVSPEAYWRERKQLTWQ